MARKLIALISGLVVPLVKLLTGKTDGAPVKLTHAAAGAVVALLVLVLLIELGPVGAEDPVVPAEDQVVPAEVVDHGCDGHRGVNALQIRVTQPGIVVIEWDNSRVCGEAV